MRTMPTTLLISALTLGASLCSAQSPANQPATAQPPQPAGASLAAPPRALPEKILRPRLIRFEGDLETAEQVALLRAALIVNEGEPPRRRPDAAVLVLSGLHAREDLVVQAAAVVRDAPLPVLALIVPARPAANQPGPASSAAGARVGLGHYLIALQASQVVGPSALEIVGRPMDTPDARTRALRDLTEADADLAPIQSLLDRTLESRGIGAENRAILRSALTSPIHPLWYVRLRADPYQLVWKGSDAKPGIADLKIEILRAIEGERTAAGESLFEFALPAVVLSEMKLIDGRQDVLQALLRERGYEGPVPQAVTIRSRLNDRRDQANKAFDAIDRVVDEARKALKLAEGAASNEKAREHRAAAARTLDDADGLLEALREAMKDMPELARLPAPGQEASAPAAHATKWRSMVQARADELRKARKELESASR
ncbi:MAG: hypothetical protein SFY95_04090 [Planctomycetota bacterium]|nr:hypothetical protein [Planctomycetota bacterium]